jgi:hypothetical protein
MQPLLLPPPNPPEPIPEDELAAILTAAIRDGRGGRMTREAALFLAGVSAEHLVERIGLAGLTVVRRADG